MPLNSTMPESTVQELKKVNWTQRRETAIKDLAEQRKHLGGLIPKNDDPLSPKWKPYYQARVLALENDALDMTARLVWANRSDKEGLIKRYLNVLDMLIQGINREEDLHVLESMMKVSVQAEARRLRREHPEYF